MKCFYVKKDFFDENFPDIRKLRNYYIALLILNLMTESIDKYETAIKFAFEKENEQSENNSDKSGTKKKDSDINYHCI